MSTADREQRLTDEDQTREEVAAALARQFVDRATAATVAWLKDSASAFGTCLTGAVAGTYTANDLAKDAAAQWARNVAYVAGVCGLGDEGDDAHETTRA